MNDGHIISHIQSRIGGKPHVCTSECCTQSMHVHVHKKDGLEHIRWSGNNKSWMNKGNFVRALKYVFICKKSGTVHHCTEECNLEPVPNDDHTLACPVSGVQWNNETEVVRSWKLTSKCVPTIVSDKRDPNMFSRTKDGKVTNITLNIKDESCKREVQRTLVLLVCSHRRKCQELEKFHHGRQMGIKQVNRYMKHCRDNGRCIVACTMLNIYITETFSKPIFLRIMARFEPQIGKITDDVYPIIVKLWNVVDMPRQIAFDIFVPAMLYILQRGIRVDGNVIISKYELFDTILPDANTLDDFGIAKSTFTQTKNTIRMCIRKLLHQYSVTELKELL